MIFYLFQSFLLRPLHHHLFLTLDRLVQISALVCLLEMDNFVVVVFELYADLGESLSHIRKVLHFLPYNQYFKFNDKSTFRFHNLIYSFIKLYHSDVNLPMSKNEQCNTGQIVLFLKIKHCIFYFVDAEIILLFNLEPEVSENSRDFFTIL